MVAYRQPRSVQSVRTADAMACNGCGRRLARSDYAFMDDQYAVLCGSCVATAYNGLVTDALSEIQEGRDA